MKKLALVIALFGAVSLAQATTCTLFSNVSGYNNNYNCSLPTVTSDNQITDCTFTFDSVNCGNRGYLYCDLVGNNSNCNVGSVGTTSTWSCTLDANGINYLNNCIASGNNCDFNLNCYGNCNIGDCKITYDCTPCPGKGVPDNALTVALLGIALLGLDMSRRKLALAR
jgi:hypothetical protein